ncbi:MAG: hypothetical protein N4A61_14665 [Pelagimonas sp.]|jgi:hypothetical protein|nr:hypothetical protein [Pelagimonas sp.]
MPIPFIVLLGLTFLCATLATLWAVSVWGATTVMPVLLISALLGRWAMMPVSQHDDQQHS